jgi:hypothetical protein
MSTTIYDNNSFRSRRGPYSDAFWQFLVLPIIGPAFVIFGLYLLCCSFADFQKLVGSGSWNLVPCTVGSVIAPPYQSNYFELQTMFFKNAQIDYSYSVNGKRYAGDVSLSPQGPRFYDDFNSFRQSGDCIEHDRISKRYQTDYRPMQGGAAPFKFASLAPGHELFVRYDPANPKSSVLAEVLEEHQQRIFGWGIGSLLIGIIVMLFGWMARWASDAEQSSDDAIEAEYARLNPGEHL